MPQLNLPKTGEPLYYYVDSDFLPNYGTGMDNWRSTTGYCAFLAGACVTHCSRRQKALATSTAHAEYLAAFKCGRDALCELGHSWGESFLIKLTRFAC
jgi:hypothetical protein